MTSGIVLMTRTLMRGVVGCTAARGSASRQKDHACECDRERDECKTDFGEVLDWFHDHIQGFVVALLPLRLRPHRLGQRSRTIFRFVIGSFSAPHTDYVIRDKIPPNLSGRTPAFIRS